MEFPTGQTPNGLPGPPRKSFVLLAFALSAVLFVSSAVFAAWAYRRAETPPAVVQAPPPAVPPPSAPAAPDWEPYVEAGEHFAVSLTSVDHRTIDADVQRILDASTGAFRRDFAGRAAEFKDVTRDAQSVSKGTVTGAGLEQLGRNRADVLVAITVETVNGGAPPEEPRSWRLRLGMVRGPGGFQTDSVEFVP